MGDENGSNGLEWHRVLRADELPEGRVTTVQAGLKSCALVHFDGKFAALDNRCPHQGGPLGEGSIEISKEQRAGEWDVWQTSLHNPNFAEYAELCGALGIRVTKASELDDAIERALAHDGAAMVEVVADPELI